MFAVQELWKDLCRSAAHCGRRITLSFFRRKEIVLNIDFAPTFLDIAGVKVPDFMDGRSILPLLRKSNSGKKIAWRDTFLIERG